MSDKITKTVTYKINSDGNCGKCDCYYDVADYGWICAAFDNTEWNKSNIEQRPECRDYLAEIKSRVYCNGCEYRVLSCRKNDFTGCKLGNPQSVDLVGRYSLNCTDRSE